LLDLLQGGELIAVLSRPCDARLNRRQREPPSPSTRAAAAVHHCHRRACSSVVEMGKEGSLGAGWDAKYEGMAGFAVGVIGGEFSPAGADPLSACV
jgi:hypothetical protein